MKILNTKASQHQRLKALIYGESGSGKTTLARTLGAKTLVISAEGGLLSVKGADIDYIDLALDDEGQPIVDARARLGRLSETFKWLHLGQDYRNVFVDSLTEIGEIMTESLNKEFPDRKDSFPMWGEYSKRMRSIVKGFRDLPYNVFMTCVSEADKDDNNRRFQGFMLQGSISKKLPQYFDEVFYLYVNEEKKRSLITAKSESLLCKDRSNRLEPQEPADLSVIAGKIFGPVVAEEETKDVGSNKRK